MTFWHCPVVYLQISVEKYSIVFILKIFVLKNTRSLRNVKFLSWKIPDCILIPKSCVEKYSIELNFAASHGSRYKWKFPPKIGSNQTFQGINGGKFKIFGVSSVVTTARFLPNSSPTPPWLPPQQEGRAGQDWRAGWGQGEWYRGQWGGQQWR